MFNSSQKSEKYVESSDGQSTPNEGLFLDSEDSDRKRRRSSFITDSIKGLSEKLSRRNSMKGDESSEEEPDVPPGQDPYSLINIIKHKGAQMIQRRKKRKSMLTEGESAITYHLLRRVDFLLSGPTERHQERNREWRESRAAVIEHRDNPIQLNGTALFYFPPSSKLRKLMFSFIFHPLVQFFSLFYTFVNVVLYIVKINQPPSSPIHSFYFYFDIIFTVFIGFEIACKILAQGFSFGRYTFLQTSIWHVLDLVIFVCAIVSILSGEVFMSVMRGFVLLKVVETISFLAPLKAMLDSLTRAISLLRGTLVFLLFVGFIFAVTAVDFFNSSLARVCVTEDGRLSSPLLHCSKYQGDGLGFVCPGNMRCLEGQGNPNYGATSFDNIFTAFITVFQIQSKSNWSSFYYALVKTETATLPTVWFVFVIFFVAFVTINMFIVAIKIVFTEFRDLQYENTKMPTYTNFMRNAITSLPSSLSSALMNQTFLRRFVRGPLHNRAIQFRRIISSFTSSFLFELFICLTIMINVLLELLKQVLTLPQNVRFTFEVLSNFFLLVYVVELILKISSQGVLKFFDNKLNQLDFVLILASVIARLAEPNLLNDSAESVGLQVLSILRMMRLFGVLYRMRIFQEILDKVMDSVLPSTVLMIFIAIILLAFSTLANQLFTRKLKSRRNYDNMINSFISLFIILTGDSWEESFYQVLTTPENGWATRVLSIPYFVSYWIMSNVLLVSLFIAIVLESFESNSHLREDTWSSVAKERVNRIFHFFKSRILKQLAKIPVISKLFRHFEKQEQKKTPKALPTLTIGGLDDRFLSAEPKPKVEPPVVEFDEVKKTRLVELLPKRVTTFARNSKHFRAFVKDVVSPDGKYHQYFAILSTLTAVIGAFPLFFEKPQEADLSLIRNIPMWLVFYDCASIIVFGGELLLKFYALGLTLFVDPFNILDLLMQTELCVTCLFYAIYGLEAKNQLLGGALRGLRALRPLRLLTRLPDFSIYIRASYRGIKDMIQVTILGLSVTFIFALLGVQLFKGMHDFCSDTSISTPLACTGMYTNPKGVVTQRAWRIPDRNFNDPFRASVTLFEMSTRSRWSEIMWPTIFHRDGTENKWNFLYFMAFLLTSAFFILNLVIAVIQSSVDAERGVAFLTPSQKSLKKLLQEIIHMRPRRKKLCWTQFYPFRMLHHLVSSRVFKILQILPVIAGSIFLAIQYGGMGDAYKFFIGDLSGYLVCLAFVLDNVLQALAYGIPAWWSKRWNRIDALIIVCGAVSMTGTGLLLVFQPNSSMFYLTAKGVSRIFLWVRVIRAGTYIPSVKFMLGTLLLCIPSIFSTLVVLVILMFGLSIFGMAFFGNIRYLRALNWDANYRSIFNSMMVLFRVLTLETWNDLLHDCNVDAPYCTRIPSEFTDCGSRWSTAFYIFFILLASNIILNLFIGILLDNFSHTFQTSPFSIVQKDLKFFSKVWKEYDPKASGYIPVEKLHLLVHDLYEQKARLGLNLSSLHERELLWVIKYEILHGVRLGGQEEKFYKYVRWNPLQGLIDRIQKLLFRRHARSSQSVFFNDALIALVRAHVSANDYSARDQAYRRYLLTRALKSISVMKIQNMINDRVMKIKMSRLIEKVNQTPHALVQMKNPLTIQEEVMSKSVLRNSHSQLNLADEGSLMQEAVTLHPDLVSMDEGSHFKRAASYTQYAPEWQGIGEFQFPSPSAVDEQMHDGFERRRMSSSSRANRNDASSVKSTTRLQQHVRGVLTSIRSLKEMVHFDRTPSPQDRRKSVVTHLDREESKEVYISPTKRPKDRSHSHRHDKDRSRRAENAAEPLSHSAKARAPRLESSFSPVVSSVKEASDVDAILRSLQRMKSEFSVRLASEHGINPDASLTTPQKRTTQSLSASRHQSERKRAPVRAKSARKRSVRKGSSKRAMSMSKKGEPKSATKNV